MTRLAPKAYRRKPMISSLLALGLILACTIIVRSSYTMARPISNGVLNQGYLWGAVSTFGTHKGVDLLYPIGTDVLAVAEGEVVAVENEIGDGQYPNEHPFGNYVLIRHVNSMRHYDGTTNSNAYAYTIYAHLRYHSLKVQVGSIVEVGTEIGESGNTGNVSGPHLHYQIVLNPQLEDELQPNNALDSENRSRNPELWLRPLANRGTVIGKVTYPNGQPVPDLVVCGLPKDGQVVPIRTYSYPWANPDDLLYDNFGTTDVDVSPGTYTLYANPRASGCGGSHTYELGTHTIYANRITYVGLYPSWLTVLRPSSNWDVQAYVATHNALSTNALTVSYFDTSKVVKQWRSTASNHSSSVIDSEPASSRTGLIVPSQDSSVFELVKYSGQPAGTTSITAFNGRGSLGWERAGTILYVPLVKDSWYDRKSEIYVTNVGTKTTRIQVDYYRANGQILSAGYRDVSPNLQLALGSEPSLPNGDVYSAVITSFDQPIVAVVLEQDSIAPNDAPALYNAYSDGSTILYAPLVKKNYGNNTSGITLQNITGSPVNFQARYYNMAGTVEVGMKSGTIPPFAPCVLYNPDSVPDGFVGSVRVTSNGKIVGEVSEEHKYGRDPRLIYNMPLQGSTNIYLPLWYDNYTAEGGDWASGVNVHNVAPINNNITITWYNLNGTVQYSEPITLSSRETRTIYNPPQLTNFRGSMWIRSTNGQPIVAASNIHNWAAPTDVDSALSFTGNNR